MQLHELKPVHRQRKSRRVGRGGKRGTYSGRGGKGQTARSGARLQPIIRELIKRYPKKRGYRFKRVSEKPAIVNIGILERKFNSGDKVSPQVLLEKRIIRRIKGKTPKVKILGKGKLTKKLIIEGCLLSKKAKEVLEKVTG
mgnify:CR=1 FL=1